MADRNFDEEFDYGSQEGHSFVLGGHTFHTSAVAPPGAFLAGGRGLVAAVRFLRKVVVPAERPELERVLEMGDSSATLLDLAPELLATAALLIAVEETGNKDAKDKALDDLRVIVEKAMAPEESSGVIISAHQVDTVAEWLMEVTIGRPTQSLSSSGNGDGRTSNGSKAASRKPARAGKT